MWNTNRRIIPTLLLTAFIMWTFPWPSLSQSGLTDESVQQVLKDLSSSKFKERKRAQKKIKDHYDEIVDNLVEFAKASRPEATKDFDSSWTLAVELLGELRARKAIPYLITEIATAPPTLLLQDDNLRSHPCALALFRIGIPSIDPILRRLEHTATRREMVMFAYTIQAILGRDLALIKLEKELERGIHDNKTHVSELLEIVRSRDYSFE